MSIRSEDRERLENVLKVFVLLLRINAKKYKPTIFRILVHSSLFSHNFAKVAVFFIDFDKFDLLLRNFEILTLLL